MKIVGLITEYNPFHNGHLYHIKESLRVTGADAAVVVMSGDYVQRGTPAIMPKRIRAEMALMCGAGAVFELPVCYATGSAELFALGSVSLLESLGIVDSICFGSECNDLPILEQLAELLLEEPEAYQILLKDYLKQGMSFPRARQEAILSYTEDPRFAEILRNPNNILGIEYLKAAHRLGFSPQWAAIPRKGAGHDQHGEEKGLMSASYVRHLLEAGDWSEAQKGLPEICLPLYQQAFVSGVAPVRLGNLERNMLALLRTRPLDWLKNLPDVSEGLENRLYAGIRQARSIVELYQLVQTKRYPQSRARRMALHGFLGVTASMQKIRPPYLRILGIGFGGEEILRQMKKTAVIPFSQSLARLSEESEDAKRFAQLEAAATDQYVLGMPKPLPCGWEFTAPVVKERRSRHVG